MLDLTVTDKLKRPRRPRITTKEKTTMKFKKTEFGKLEKGQIFSLNAVDRDVHGNSYAEMAEKIDENHYRRIGNGSLLIQCSTSKIVFLEV